MTARKRPNQKDGADVLHLNDFRDIERKPIADALQARQDRIDLVRSHITDHLSNADAHAVAAAMVYLDTSGRIGVAAAGIESAMAQCFSNELRDVAATIERHRFARRRGHRQRGAASWLLLSAIGFVVATYINDIAWVDAALSLAAQLTAARLGRRGID